MLCRLFFNCIDVTVFPDLGYQLDKCVVLYFTAILRDILTSLETVKQNQQMILLHLQRSSQQPIVVPEITCIPLKSLDDLKMLEESIATQAEYKEKLVGEIVALWPFH